MLCENEKQAVTVKSQLQQLARPMYSNPPLHGAQIVSTILGDPELKSLWLKEVKVTLPVITILLSPKKWRILSCETRYFPHVHFFCVGLFN